VDGQELLLRIAHAQERYYSTYNSYGALGDIGFTDDHSEKGYYRAHLTLGSAGGAGTQGYVATARPQGVQVRDACLDLTISNTGRKGASGDDSNGHCW
jgi:type IV pilus assembly protein PilE